MLSSIELNGRPFVRIRYFLPNALSRGPRARAERLGMDWFSPDILPVTLQLAAVVLLLIAFGVFIFAVALPVHRLVRKLADYAESKGDTEPKRRFKNDADVLAHVFKLLTQDLREKENRLQILYEQARDRARFMERYSDRLVESVPAAVLGFDERGRLTALNSNAEALFRLRLTEVSGKSPLELFTDYPGLGALMEAAVREAKVLRDSPWELAVPSGGSTLTLEVSGAPLPAGEDKPGGYVAVIHDRTPMRRLEAQVRLNERLEALVDLSTGLAHQFRNPLSGILGYADLISKKTGGTGEIAEMASVIREEGLQLKKVVDDFLEFLRHRQSAEKPLRWSEVLADAARDLDRAFRDREVLYHSTISEGEPVVDLDRVSAYQVAANLLLNALEASPSGARVEVVSGSEEDGRWAVLSVEDQGPGVPDHLITQIFNPFFTTKTEGKGLGLAIVQRVAQAAGGRAEAGRSSLGGARFILRLPAVSPEGKANRGVVENAKGEGDP